MNVCISVDDRIEEIDGDISLHDIVKKDLEKLIIPDEMYHVTMFNILIGMNGTYFLKYT